MAWRKNKPAETPSVMEQVTGVMPGEEYNPMAQAPAQQKKWTQEIPEQKSVGSWSLEEVPTERVTFIKNNRTGEYLTDQMALVKILNILEE